MYRNSECERLCETSVARRRYAAASTRSQGYRHAPCREEASRVASLALQTAHVAWLAYLLFRFDTYVIRGHEARRSYFLMFNLPMRSLAVLVLGFRGQFLFEYTAL